MSKRTKVSVCFQHDMSDSWYEARFPDPEYDGSYSHHTSIEQIAIKNNWQINWLGDSRYNPWRDRNNGK